MPLAIENHKGWRSAEQVEWLKSIGSEYVGVCVDMCNNVALVETPMQTIKTLAPCALFVSFKDTAAEFCEDGIQSRARPIREAANPGRRVAESPRWRNAQLDPIDVLRCESAQAPRRR